MAEEQQSTTPSIDPPWPESNGIWATYDLHCHCGAIRYKMKISPPLLPEDTQGKEQYTAVECHCSHCERQGALCVHPLTKNVEFTQGFEDKGVHLTASKRNPHYFCKTCGCFVATDLTYLMEEVFKTESRLTINVSARYSSRVHIILLIR